MKDWMIAVGVGALVFFLWPSSEKWTLDHDVIAIRIDRKSTVTIPKGAVIEITQTDDDGTVHFVWKGTAYLAAQVELREQFEP